MLSSSNDKKGFTLIELLVVMAIILLLAGAVTPVIARAREQGRRTKCASNLRQIGIALHLYAGDTNEAFPANLALLYPNYVADQSVFDCPSSSAVGNAAIPNYTYVTGLTESTPSNTTIAYDIVGTNHSNYCNVLYVDGSVGGYSGSGAPPATRP